MTVLSTLLTLLLVRLDTDRPRMPVIGQLWMRAVFLHMQTDAETNLFTSTHLCGWCLSTEIKWH